MSFRPAGCGNGGKNGWHIHRRLGDINGRGREIDGRWQSPDVHKEAGQTKVYREEDISLGRGHGSQCGCQSSKEEKFLHKISFVAHSTGGLKDYSSHRND